MTFCKYKSITAHVGHDLGESAVREGFENWRAWRGVLTDNYETELSGNRSSSTNT